MGWWAPVVPATWEAEAAWPKTHAETVGMLCGVMANSMALDYAMSINESRSSSVAYAIVYPVGMFVRIISAQILLSFFL